MPNMNVEGCKAAYEASGCTPQAAPFSHSESENHTNIPIVGFILAGIVIAESEHRSLYPPSAIAYLWQSSSL